MTPMTAMQRVTTGAVAALTATAALAGVASPAFAAYPYDQFTLPYGNSVASGKITFYDRSVSFTGTLRVTAGNCRGLRFDTYALSVQLQNSFTGLYCNEGTSTKTYNVVNFTAAANVAGGATLAEFRMYDRSGTLAQYNCYKISVSNP
jgi:hypothetical protein